MAEATFAFDLHVLGTPPALILSQDQTLKLNGLPVRDAELKFGATGEHISLTLSAC